MERDQDDLHERYKFIIENIKDVAWKLNPDFVFTFVSHNIKDMTGHKPEELLGQRMLDFLTEDSKKYIYGLIGKKTKNGTEELVLMAVQFICKDGSAKWVEVSGNRIFERGNFAGYIGTTRDISEKKQYENNLNKYIDELRAMNARLEKMATVDVLTGIYNRRKFDDALSAIIDMKGSSIPFSLIFFDIDNFKSINDSFGHKVGDHVLQQISKLVLDNIRATDGLFRWGGEEFILILPDANLESAENIAEKIRNLIQDYDFNIGHKITVSLGIGEHIAGESADQMMKRVDSALIRAKFQGKNRIVSG